MAVASIIGCIRLTGHAGDKNYAFYLMPLRAWEFIGGGATVWALPLVRRLPRVALEVLGLVGLIGVLSSDWLITSADNFPSYLASLPVAGAVVLIGANSAHPKLVSGQILALPLFVWVGLISYALYLWHWPVLVFLKIFNYDGHIQYSWAIVVGISLALSWLTRVIVEKPILAWRRSRKVPRLSLRPALVGVAACAAWAALGNVGLTSAAASASAQQLKWLGRQEHGCYINIANPLKTCATTLDYGILVGDSHAMSTTSDFTDFAKANHSSLITIAVGACVSLFTAQVQIPDTEMRTHCASERELMLKLFESGELHPKYAILYSRWSIYTQPTGAYALSDARGVKKSVQDTFVSETENTLSFLASHGVARILVIGPSPTFDRSAPQCLASVAKYGGNISFCQTPAAHNNNVQRNVQTWLREATNIPSVRYIDASAVFCTTTVCTPYDSSGRPLFVDNNHVSDDGAAQILSKFGDDFKWVMTGT